MSHKKKVSDLDFATLIQSQVKEGRLLFNQQRAIIIDVDALGALRQQLIETLGMEFAQGILSHFGYEHGYDDAKRLEKSFDWETETDWLAAGPFIHTLQGLVHVTVEKIDFERDNGGETGHFQMEGIWHNSYEVEAHLKRYDPGERPVCWSLTGYASGYASAFFGRDLLAVETECVGKGDDRCYWEIRPVAEWDVSAVAPHIQALEAIDLTGQLAETNQRLQESQARFRDIALSSTDWIWEVDTKGQYSYCSKQVQDVLGYTVEEILGKTPFDLMQADEATRVAKIFDKITADQRPIVDMVHWNIGKDERAVCLLTNGVPRFDEQGSFVGYRGVDKDITERRLAEMERERMLAKMKKQAHQLEDALAQAEALYNISRDLNAAGDEDELLHVMVKPAAEAGAASANLIYLDLDETDTPVWAEVVAAWQRQDGSDAVALAPVGTRYYLPEFPLINLWLSDPEKPLLIADVSTHKQISHKIKRAMAETGNRAMVIVPLTQGGGRWIGLIIFYWDQPHEFSEREVEIYRAFVGMGSPTVADRRLFALAQARASRQQALHEITAIASASKDMTELASRLPDIIEPLRRLVPVNLLSVATCIPGESEYTLFAIVEMQKSGQFSRRGTRAPLEGSAPGWVIANREPLLDADMRAPTLQQGRPFIGDEQLIAEGIVSRLHLPLQFGGQIVGTLNLGSNQPNTFTYEHLPILRQIASQIAQTMERSRLLENIRAALEETAVLYEGSARVVHAATANEVLQALVEFTPLEHFDRANVLIFDHPWQDENPPTLLTSAASWERDALFAGKTSGAPVGTTFSLDQYPLWGLISRDEPVYVHDVAFHEGISKDLCAFLRDKMGIRSLVIWPLVSGGQWLGLLTGQSGTEHKMEQDEIRQVASLAGQAAAVLQSQHLFAQAQARARRERLVRTVTDKIRLGADRDTIMQTTLRELSQILGASKSIAHLGTQEELRLVQTRELVENPDDAGRPGQS